MTEHKFKRLYLDTYWEGMECELCGCQGFRATFKNEVVDDRTTVWLEYNHEGKRIPTTNCTDYINSKVTTKMLLPWQRKVYKAFRKRMNHLYISRKSIDFEIGINLQWLPSHMHMADSWLSLRVGNNVFLFIESFGGIYELHYGKAKMSMPAKITVAHDHLVLDDLLYIIDNSDEIVEQLCYASKIATEHRNNLIREIIE